MWRQRAELSDLDADALDGLSTLWLGQARTPKDEVIAHVAICEPAGLKARRNGQGRRGGMKRSAYSHAQALGRAQSLWLQMAEVEVYEATRTGRRQATRRASRAGPLSSPISLDNSGPMASLTRKVRFAGPGFGHFLSDLARKWPPSAQDLDYDHLRQTWEKRLTRT